MSKVIYAYEYGFSPDNDGVKNRDALQRIADVGGEIVIDKPGTYRVLGTVILKSDTTVKCCAGVYIRREGTKEDNAGPLFINAGAFTHVYDRHIGIVGLNLITCGNDCGNAGIPGINGHIALYYVKDSYIRDFECLDLGKHTFCIQVCTFENVIIENVHIEGLKDAVHYGPGKRFVLRHGVFRTFDDPIALNANDYVGSNPQMGWIEDGVIEDCYDLDQPETTGFFCRLLGGAWKDWEKGMVIREADTVVSEGRMYRASIGYDGKEFVTEHRPTHEKGAVELDGINWVMTQDDNVVHNCGCRNIHFRDIFLEKKRPIAFQFHFDNDNYSHSYYPYSDAPVQTDITFENIHTNGNVEYLIRSTTPVGRVIVKDSFLDSCKIRFAHRGVPGIVYGKTDVIVSGCHITGTLSLESAEGRECAFVTEGNLLADGAEIKK